MSKHQPYYFYANANANAEGEKKRTDPDIFGCQKHQHTAQNNQRNG